MAEYTAGAFEALIHENVHREDPAAPGAYMRTCEICGAEYEAQAQALRIGPHPERVAPGDWLGRELHNKSDDDCPVIGCGTEGPCPLHDDDTDDENELDHGYDPFA